MGQGVSVLRLGLVDYEEACRLQEELAAARARGLLGDVLLLLEHPAVITVGRGGGWEDILAPAAQLEQLGIRVLPADRGGKATYHGPGQLVVYPIVAVAAGNLHGFVWRLEEVAIRVLDSYGLAAGRLEGQPGVWLRDDKIAAVGLNVRDGIARHGLALNVAPSLAHFDLLIACGIAGRGVTSLARELGSQPDMAEVADRLVQSFGQVFACQPVAAGPGLLDRVRAAPPPPSAEQPAWLWRQLSPEDELAVDRMERLLADLCLHTVCQEARCPNLAECFGQGTAAFLILGDACTRACRFCAVRHGRPAPPDPQEPERVAQAAARLGLEHVVITSVTRDDLPDGGAGHFAATIQAVRRRLTRVRLEVLIPDLNGSRPALAAVLAARPDVLNHNLETVPRLYPQVRPRAAYTRSLDILTWAKALSPEILTKSGLMLGLGEHTAEVVRVLHDLRRAGCDLLTLGQYLQPSDEQLGVVHYLPPELFDAYRDKAQSLGFRGVASGPWVRSSHQARALWLAAHESSAAGTPTGLPGPLPL